MMSEKNVVVGLVASKLDLAKEDGKRQVDPAEAEAFAKKNGLVVFKETSAKTGEGVEQFFCGLADGMLDAHRNGKGVGTKTPGALKITQPPKAKKSNCGGCA